jgi:NTP pyrophosphatase (non-canonical NTP hydrolase)
MKREWDQFHTPENLAKSINIEAGELLECFQWDNNFNLENVKDELADIFMYSIILAYKLDLDILEIINSKIDVNEKRYDVEHSKGNSKKYTEF